MKETFKQFKQNAEAVSTVIVEILSQQQIPIYIKELALAKNMNKIAIAGFDNNDLNELRNTKDGLIFFENNLKENAQNIEIGITPAQYGIAETGSIVLHSDDENVRIASMLSEIHIVILDKKNIVAKQSDLSEILKKWFAKPANYTAFITGPSRTADIERVLALGAHGPIELYVIII